MEYQNKFAEDLINELAWILQDESGETTVYHPDLFVQAFTDNSYLTIDPTAKDNHELARLGKEYLSLFTSRFLFNCLTKKDIEMGKCIDKTVYFKYRNRLLDPKRISAIARRWHYDLLVRKGESVDLEQEEQALVFVVEALIGAMVEDDIQKNVCFMGGENQIVDLSFDEKKAFDKKIEKLMMIDDFFKEIKLN
jgi:hypothetical protein